MTASSESISMFRNSGRELLPTVLPAAAVQPSAVPVDLLSVTGATPHLDSLSHKRLDLLRPPSNPALYMGKSKYSHNS